MRRFAYAIAAVLALSPVILLAPASAPSSAAVTHPHAAAAAACHSEGPWSNFFNGGGGYLWASGTAAGDQLYSYADGSGNSVEWCMVDEGGGNYGFRLKNTSECAEYSGPEQGPGKVILAGCDSSKAGQQWDFASGDGTFPYVIWNGDWSYEGITCLSSNKGTKEPVIAATPGPGDQPCNGYGGQSWTGTY
jgi:hypothetical protein